MPSCFGGQEEPADEYDLLPWSLKWKMRFGKKETDQHSGQPVLRLGNNRLLQTCCHNTEYQALLLVDRHTSVPTYKVIGIYNRPEGKLVEYEAVQGKPLDTKWPSMSQQQKRKVIFDLGRFVEQLRKMQPPKHFVIGDATLGSALDHRFGSGRIGPFYTLDAFHDFVRRGHPVEDFVEKEVQYTHKRASSYELKFTHANLCPQNILVDDAGKPCALIGWESSGWYPEYWEYTQMHSGTPKTMGDWLEAMCTVVPRYDKELVADAACRKRFNANMYNLPRSVRLPSLTPSELHREGLEIEDMNTDNTSG